MQIISISGLDGSGKSTQIEMLKKHLESKDKKVFYFHIIKFSFVQKLKEFKQKYCLICKLRNSCKSKIIIEEKSVTKANWLQIQLRKIALYIDIWRFKKFYKKMENDSYDFILSDRYFYDTIINIAYLSKTKFFIDAKIPTPDFSFYISIDPENIMKRERAIDQKIDYLEDKKNLYDLLCEEFGLIKIDGNRQKDEILNDILSKIAL